MDFESLLLLHEENELKNEELLLFLNIEKYKNLEIP